MSDLFGVIGTDSLSAESKRGFEKLSGEMRSLGFGDLSRLDGKTAALGVIDYASRLGTAFIRKVEATSTLLSWNAGYLLEPSKIIDVSRSVSNEETAHACLSTLEPPFSGCRVDEGSGVAYLYVDRYGLQPVYYAISKGALCFSSKLGPLLRSGLIDWELDPDAVVEFFTFEHLTDNRTFAKEVRVLAPATVLEFANGSATLHPYSTTRFTQDNTSLTMDDIAKELYEKLNASVSRSLDGASRVAITLSGGLDSRAILGVALRHGAEIKSYTFGTPSCRDIRFAQAMAQKCGISHTVLHIDSSFLPDWLPHAVEITGGMISAVHFQIVSMAEHIAAEADLILDGLAGDALTGAHIRWGMVTANSIERASECLYRQRATVLRDEASRREFFEPEFLNSITVGPRENLHTHFENPVIAPAWWGCHQFDLLERQRRFIQFGPHLVRPFVDVRTPFYSVGLVEMMKQIPLRFLLEQRVYLHMHRRYLPELARIPDTARGLPLTYPDSIRFAKRVLDAGLRRFPVPVQRFLPKAEESPTDYAAWFRDPLRSFVEESLLDDRSPFDGIIQPTKIEEKLTEHFLGTSNHTNLIGCLLSFATWRRSVRCQKTIQTSGLDARARTSST